MMRNRRCRCGKRFRPKRRNQHHHSAACRIAAYNASDKGTARSQRYNTSEKRKRVQAAYNRSEKGAVRRDRWQYSKAGRAWRDIFTGKAEKQKAKKEKLKQKRIARAELKEVLQRLAAVTGDRREAA